VTEPRGADPLAALAATIGRALAQEVSAVGSAPASISAWRAARSSWGQVRLTLTRAAAWLVLPGLPGGVVLDPDPALAAQPELARAADRAVRAALTPTVQWSRGEVGRTKLTDDLGMLVLGFEVRQGAAAWRCRVCLPGPTLAAIVAAPPGRRPEGRDGGVTPAGPSNPSNPSNLPPQVELVRELAKADPAYIAKLLSQLLREDRR
jgi:hypothetical protein